MRRAVAPRSQLSFMSIFFSFELSIDRCAAMDDGAMQPGSGGDGRPKAGLSSRLVSQVGGRLEYLGHFL